ncbi:MAG TPA: 4Fe-4S dicluster domain-containing protein, partial [Thermoplasmatales archaeon]|nr:4Fe-4S dicluster domain-containing protein [Thermoplasmatales archaeon]
YRVGGIDISLEEGVRASERETLVRDIIYRGIECVGCGVCVAKCPQNAIYMKDGKAWIGESCIHCLQCMDECPVIVFR